MSSPMRVFLAHPKSFSDEQIEHWKQAVGTQMRSQLELEHVEVIPGRDDYQKYAPAAGGFPGWVRDVPTRKNAMTAKPYYDAIVVPGGAVGRATADIVMRALGQKLPVLRVLETEDGFQFARVAQVVVEDQENYIDGWYLEVE